MKPILFLLTFCVPLLSFAQQDTIRLVVGKQVAQLDSTHPENAHVIIYSNSRDSSIASEFNYLHGKINGERRNYLNGKVHTIANYKDGKKDGLFQSNYLSGNAERKEIYKEGVFVSGRSFDQEGNEIPYYKEPFSFVEKMPTAPYDVNKYLKKHLRYPANALKAGVEGKVAVKFIVNEDGTISNPQVLRGFDKECDEEAKRVVAEMPNWNPGSQNRKFVKVYSFLPINFTIKE